MNLSPPEENGKLMLSVEQPASLFLALVFVPFISKLFSMCVCGGGGLREGSRPWWDAPDDGAFHFPRQTINLLRSSSGRLAAVDPDGV